MGIGFDSTTAFTRPYRNRLRQCRRYACPLAFAPSNSDPAAIGLAFLSRPWSGDFGQLLSATTAALNGAGLLFEFNM